MSGRRWKVSCDIYHKPGWEPHHSSIHIFVGLFEWVGPWQETNGPGPFLLGPIRIRCERERELNLEESQNLQRVLLNLQMGLLVWLKPRSLFPRQGNLISSDLPHSWELLLIPSPQYLNSRDIEETRNELTLCMSQLPVRPLSMV